MNLNLISSLKLKYWIAAIFHIPYFLELMLLTKYEIIEIQKIEVTIYSGTVSNSSRS